MDADSTTPEKARVNCPGCRRLFEFDNENRGCATTCPKCQCDFLIPEKGNEGVLLSVDQECFDIVCPHCNTEFVLPAEYRGEVADCAECHGVFLIPEEGTQGLPIDDADTTAPAAAGAAPAADAGPRAAPTAPPSGQGRSATVFLSRKEVLDQAEKAQRERMGRLAEPSGIQRADEPVASPAASGSPAAGAKAPHVLEPVLGRAIRRSELPDWLPPLDFEKREKIVEFEPAADLPTAALKVTVLVPVLLIPVAAVLVGYLHLHPAAAAAICFVPGLVCWGIAIARLVPVLSRKVLILTNFRVIMADPFEVVDIDLL